MSDLLEIKHLPPTNAEDVYLKGHAVFATLTPCDPQTWQAFTTVVDWAQHLPNDLSETVLRLRLHETAKQPIDSLLPYKPQRPTEALAWNGCYAFSLATRPKFNQVGWTAGYGPHDLLSADPSTGAKWPDLIVAIGPFVKEANALNHRMARFNFSPDQSASFSIYSLVPNAVRVDGRLLQEHE